MWLRTIGTRTQTSTIRDIWASSDGLRDADGNDIDIVINGVHSDYASTPGEVEDLGIQNPLDAGSQTRYKNLDYVPGCAHEAHHGRRGLRDRPP